MRQDNLRPIISNSGDIKQQAGLKLGQTWRRSKWSSKSNVKLMGEQGECTCYQKLFTEYVLRGPKCVLPTVTHVQKTILILVFLVDRRHQGSCIKMTVKLHSKNNKINTNAFTLSHQSAVVNSSQRRRWPFQHRA